MSHTASSEATRGAPGQERIFSQLDQITAAGDLALRSLTAERDPAKAADSLIENGGLFRDEFAALQYDLNAVWGEDEAGNAVSLSICDHNCTTEAHVKQVVIPTGGNYNCPASLEANRGKGASIKWLAPAAKIMSSFPTLEQGLKKFREDFFKKSGGFDSYVERFDVPLHVAQAIKRRLDQSKNTPDSPERLAVNLFGGNPEMHPEILDLIREIKERGHNVHFTTTGRVFLRDPDHKFLTTFLEHPPDLIALSADDFEDAEQIRRLAQGDRPEDERSIQETLDKLVKDWKRIPWYRGQAQKAHEAVYVALLAQHPDYAKKFPSVLFNMVLHPGNLAHAESIIAELHKQFPNALINPFPAQSAFDKNEGSAFSVSDAPALRDFVGKMLKCQSESVLRDKRPTPFVPRLHYWMMLQAVFDWAGDDSELAMRTISGDGAWLCFEDPAAGRLLQIGKASEDYKRKELGQVAGGFKGCFWNNETITDDDQQVWDEVPEDIAYYMQHGRQELSAGAKHTCKGCAFPRITDDMLATETGMHPGIYKHYKKRRDAFMSLYLLHG